MLFLKDEHRKCEAPPLNSQCILSDPSGSWPGKLRKRRQDKTGTMSALRNENTELKRQRGRQCKDSGKMLSAK